MRRHIDRHIRRHELIKKGEQSSFYGTPVEEMNREDLLMMIGYLGEARAEEQLRHKRTKERLRLFDKTPVLGVLG